MILLEFSLDIIYLSPMGLAEIYDSMHGGPRSTQRCATVPVM